MAAETLHERPRLHVVESPPVVEIEPWELHSELVLVCPDVRGRALEQLPEHRPFGSRPSAEPIAAAKTHRESEPSKAILPSSIAGYVLWRLLQTARTGLLLVAALVFLASVAELTH